MNTNSDLSLFSALPEIVIHFILSFLPIMDYKEYNDFVISYKKRIERICEINKTNNINKKMIFNNYTYFHNFNKIFINKISDNIILNKVKDNRFMELDYDLTYNSNYSDKHVIVFYYYENPSYYIILDRDSNIINKINNNTITYYEILELLDSNNPNAYYNSDKILKKDDLNLLLNNRHILLNNELINTIDCISIFKFKDHFTEINICNDLFDPDFSGDDD
jgi:hypothetical protein